MEVIIVIVIIPLLLYAPLHHHHLVLGVFSKNNIDYRQWRSNRV